MEQPGASFDPSHAIPAHMMLAHYVEGSDGRLRARPRIHAYTGRFKKNTC